MNLLKTDTYELVWITDPKTRYAILSHRWEPQEIDYQLIQTLKPSALRNPSFPGIPAHLRASAAKLRAACATAQQQEIAYLWIDTCCIDKRSSVELGRAINSAFQWFHNAAVCYAHLKDVTFSAPDEKMFMSDDPNQRGQPSEWFERAWTLQELLAPRKLQLYDKRWKSMGTRDEHATLISRINGISTEYVTGKRPLSEASCALRMSWMAGRVTERVEDIAYSLLGIFDVNLSPQYSEGTRAFERLQRAIMSAYGVFDESLFAWERPQDSLLRCYQNEPRAREFKNSSWGLLAPSPDCFTRTGNVFVRRDLTVMRPGGGFRLSHQGICITMSSKEMEHRFGGPRNEVMFPLNCWRVISGQIPEAIVLRLSRGADGVILRSQCQELTSQRSAKASHKGSAVIAVAQPRIAQF